MDDQESESMLQVETSASLKEKITPGTKKVRGTNTPDLFIFPGSKSRKGTIFRWFPFSPDYKLNKIARTLKSAKNAERRGNNRKAKVLYEDAIERLENMETDYLKESQLKKKSHLHRSACWMLADLYISEKDCPKAKDYLDKGKKIIPPRTLEEFLWIGDRYLKVGHLLLSDVGKVDEAINLFEEAEKYKPSLDEKANQELVKSWADKGRMDRKAMQKYFQYLKPDEWMKGRFRSVIYNGCKIDPKSENEVKDKITYNRRISAFHDRLDWPHKNLGHGYVIQGDYGKAVSHFEKAKEITNSQDYSFWIGKASYLAVDYKKSYQEFSNLPQEIQVRYKGEYELFYGLTLAHLLFDGSGFNDLSVNMDEAACYLETALRIVKGADILIPKATFLLGKIKTRQKKFDESIPLFQAAIDKDPYNSQYLSALADVLSEVGQGNEAITYFKRAILYGMDNDENAELMIAVGDLLREEGKNREAERWDILAKKKDSELPRILLNDANRFLEALKFQEAFEKAKKIQGKIEKIHRKRDEVIRDMHFILGRCNVRFAKFREAQESLKRSLNWGRDSWDTYYWLGLSLAHQEKYDDAKKHLTNSLKKNGNHPNTYIQMGNIILLQEVPEVISKAIEYFSIAKKLCEDSSMLYQNALYGLGKCYQKEGNNKEAKSQFNHLLTIDPNHEGANYSLATIYEKEGALEECEKRLRLIIEKYKNDGSNQVSSFLGPSYVKLGILLCNNENEKALKEADEMLDSAIKIGHEDDTVIFYKGLIEVKTGRLEQGYSRWLKLYEKDKTNHELKENLAKVNYLLGIALFNKGKYQDAIKKLKLCRKVFEQSDQLNIPEWIAEAYFQSGLNLLKGNSDEPQPNAGFVEQADEFFDKAIEMNPKAEGYLVAKGICELYRGEGHLEKAEEYFSRVLEHDHENGMALFFSGLCNFLQGGDGKKGLTLERFQNLLSKEMVDDRMRDMAQLIVAWEEIKNGNNEAIDLLLPLLEREEIVNRLPFPIIPFNSWLAYNLLQRYDKKAIDIIEKIHNHSSLDMFQYALALVHGLKGSYEKAISHFERIYQKEKKNKKIADQYASMLCYRAAQNVKKDKVKEALSDLNFAKRVLSGS